MLIQSQSPSLRPLTTAHLAQTMSLLELNSMELAQEIEAQLAANPALEIVDERRCPSCRRRLPDSGPCPICTRPKSDQQEEPIVFLSSRDDFRSYGGGGYSGEEAPDEAWIADTVDLPTYVLRQIAPELKPEDRALAAHILTSLDEDGLLTVPILEIARYHHVLPSRVQAVLSLIQHAEPVGVGSPSPKEALLVQLEVLAKIRPVPALAERAVQEGMDLLSRRAYTSLGHLLGISASQAREIGTFIAENLNPFPGRAHWGDIHNNPAPRPIYQDPDVVVSRLRETPDTPLVVEVISPFAGKLRVNPMFRKALANANGNSDQWQSDLDQAVLLVKCLRQRDHTLVRLMKRVVVLQRAFLLHGDAEMIPLTRAELADELDVHESTVSRAVSGKMMQLPNKRVVPIARLFDRSLHVRTALRQIIAQENKPLSDSQIARHLADQGFSVARRTVAKYRAMEGILPARYRNRV